VQQLLLALPILLFSMVAHEYAHGWAALRQGDDTAYALGRLTLNPIKHVDPFMTILLPIMLGVATQGRMIFGGAKPVPVNPRNYRNYRRGDVIVSAAGIVTNLGLALACFILAFVVGIVGGALGGGSVAATLLQQILFWGIWLNLLLAFFNLAPIPPLDGSHILYHLLPPRLGAHYRALSRYGLIILVALLWFVPGVLEVILAPAFFLYHLAAVGLGSHVLGALPLL
jgi:Zn-dependent protease